MVFFDASNHNDYYRININKSTKVVEYNYGEKLVDYGYVGSGDTAAEGKLLAMNSDGWGTLTHNLPILTTAPSEANTEGGIIIVVLSSEPATKYSGYLYLIVGS